MTLAVGSKAPNFSLLATDGKNYSLKDFEEASILVVFFTCNHCPYVKGSNDLTKSTALKFSSKGVRFISINSNDAQTYPEDSFENMVTLMDTENFPWIYLHDKTQSIAHAYEATKTPQFFVFNEKRTLIYSGRAVDNPKNSALVTKNDLDEVLSSLFIKKNSSLSINNTYRMFYKMENFSSRF